MARLGKEKILLNFPTPIVRVVAKVGINEVKEYFMQLQAAFPHSTVLHLSVWPAQVEQESLFCNDHLESSKRYRHAALHEDKS